MYRQLSARLFVLLTVLMIGLFSSYTYLNIKVQKEHLMQNVITNADRASELIMRSTRYSMLLNRKEDVYQIINTIGNAEGFDGIRIYSKTGKIIFSTDQNELDHIINMNAEACNICHSDGPPRKSLTSSLATRIFRSEKGYRVLGLINPIKNDNDCSSASCHAHPPSQTILGVLDVKMSLQQLDEDLADSQRKTIIYFLITILVVAIVSGIFIRQMVHIPVKMLMDGTRALSNGNMDHHIKIDRTDEIGELSRSFNQMTEDLRDARNEITTWSNTLEQKVTEKTEELKKAHHHILQVEKMASLGKLSASVAHEINNPLAGILTYTKLVLKKLSGKKLTLVDKEKIDGYLNLIQNETSRCGNIVKNLLLFARKSDTEFTKANIVSIVNKSLLLIDHHLKIQNIKLNKNIPIKPVYLMCNANEINQALLALLINAVESMESGGKLSIEVAGAKENNLVEIQISDTGHGISEEILPHIFDPFYTTKEDGKGVGLGLSVAYGIIKRHNGTINVSSNLIQGTTFSLALPVKSVILTDEQEFPFD